MKGAKANDQPSKGAKDPPSIVFPMTRGPYQNNGASPWYTETTLGTPGQTLKFSLDSGTNMVWSTSTLCSPTSCQHYSGGRFNYQASSSFKFTDCIQIPFSFGPWGTMQVEIGQDELGLPGGGTLPVNFYLAADYSGSQFAQLDWDGGIGIPSGSAYKQGGTSFIVQELMNRGLVDPSWPFVSFDWDQTTSTGSCRIGEYDPSKIILSEGIWMPWNPYTKFGGVEYVWTTPMEAYFVGSQLVAQNVQFALDSGSSQFKGDNDIMNETLSLINTMGSPPVRLGINGGVMTITSNIYNVAIQEGPDKGKILPQFNPLGLTDLVLVGSVVMENCYTIHKYRVVECEPGVYSLAPDGMFVFNKPGGAKIVTKPNVEKFELGPIKPAKGRCLEK